MTTDEHGDAIPGGDPGAEPPVGLGARLRAVWANPANRFVALFLLYLVLLATLYPRARERFQFVVDWMAEATAAVEHVILGLFGRSTTLTGKIVTYDGFAVKIIEECTGIYEILIFAAAVLAFPTTWRKKAIGLLIGGPLLYLFNVIRILMLIFIGRYYNSIFDFMHLYFWQATLILMITSVWLLWIFKVVRHEPKATAV